MYFPLNKDEHPENHLLMVGERLANPEPEFGPYTFAALHDAFELVRDRKNWKNPINAVIYESNAAVVDAAIAFFAGSEAEFYRPPRDPHLLLVHAEGYYMSIGS